MPSPNISCSACNQILSNPTKNSSYLCPKKHLVIHYNNSIHSYSIYSNIKPNMKRIISLPNCTFFVTHIEEFKLIHNNFIPPIINNNVFMINETFNRIIKLLPFI